MLAAYDLLLMLEYEMGSANESCCGYVPKEILAVTEEHKQAKLDTMAA